MLDSYKPATTWLQGASHLVHTCVLYFTSVNGVHPKGKVKLLHNFTAVLHNTVGGQCV